MGEEEAEVVILKTKRDLEQYLRWLGAPEEEISKRMEALPDEPGTSFIIEEGEIIPLNPGLTTLN